MKMSALPQKTIVITSLPNQTARNLLYEDNMDDIYGDSGGPRKRRRLTHLTPEEKMLRRKLKNRVAAQTARDRKKVLMTDLESRVAQLEAENKRLTMENNALKARTGSLTVENVALKDRLSAVGGTSSKTESESGSAAGTGSDSVQLDSPVSDDTRPDTFVSLLQSRQQQQSTTTQAQSVQPGSRNRVTVQTTATNGLVGPTPKELDSFNELIQFDHVYYKPSPQSKSASQSQEIIQTLNTESEKLVQKVTGNGCKNVKIIITSDPSNLKNGKNVENGMINEKVLTIPNMILDTTVLQKVSNLANSHPVSQRDIAPSHTDVPTSTVLDTPANTQGDDSDLMDLNFDLLEDLENIINADFEVLTSADTDSLLSSDQDNVTIDQSTDKQIKGSKRKLVDNHTDSITDLIANVPSPSKSLSAYSDSDYMSATPSPYSSHDISSPLSDSESSPLGESLWEESFTELFPDLM